MERVAGIEPALSGRKHDILPLNYTRNYSLSIIHKKWSKRKVQKIV